MTRALIALSLIIALLAGAAASTAPHTFAQDSAAPNAFAALLASVPDTPENREWLTFGDFAAWNTAWNVPRPLNLMTLDLVPKVPHGLWMFVLPRQTTPPTALGMQYLLLDDQRAFYGFDFFQVDRAIETGTPPGTTTVLEHNVNPDDISAALLDSGYTAEDLSGGWTLYSLFDDYEIAFQADTEIEVPRAGSLGERNRIALNGQQMIIARATAPVTAALGAAAGDRPALADDPYYAALATALSDPALEGTGALVGVIAYPALTLNSDDIFAAFAGPSTTPEALTALREQYGLDSPETLLPQFDVAAFATFHAADASYLVLALAYNPVLAAETERAISILEAKMPDYVSLRLQQPISDRWTLDRSAIVTVNGVPVVLVVMRVENPVPPGDGEPFRPAVFNWYDMIATRDLLFLATAWPGAH